MAMRADIIMPRSPVLAPTLPPLRLQEREQALRLVLVRTADRRSGRSGRPRRLAVSFHQVVHPALSEEAGVAKLQHLLGGPDERSSECPADAAQSSQTGAAGGGRGA